MKPRDQWGPADEAAYGITSGLLICLFIAFGVGFAGVMVNVESEFISPAPGVSIPEKSGFIGCKNGIFTMENIVFKDIPQNVKVLSVGDYPKCAPVESVAGGGK